MARISGLEKEQAPTSLRAIAPAAAATGKHTRHHIALRLLPFLFVLYVANYLDRTSVAYAALRMTRDLGFDDRVFGLGNRIVRDWMGSVDVCAVMAAMLMLLIPADHRPIRKSIGST